MNNGRVVSTEDFFTLDDWNWEFLRRNRRYKKAYKAVQWIKKRLDGSSGRTEVTFNAFGSCSRFLLADRGNGREWCYYGQAGHPIYLNDLSSPDNPSSRRYKGKLIKKLKAVTRIDSTAEENGSAWTPAILQEHEIALQIDTRFNKEEILSSVDKLLSTIQPKKKLHVKKYKVYLAVWDLRQQKITLKEIAATLWRREYQKKGGPNYKEGVKGALVQRVSDHEKAAQKLIEASFPPRTRRIRNKP
jgi:hypothetical protein